MRSVKTIFVAIILLWTLNAWAMAQEAATVITTGEALAAMTYDGNYILGNDIALTEVWTPMYFEGTLDGNGHTITGLEIHCATESNVGMFSWLKGTVSNLCIEDAHIAAYNGGDCYASIIGTCDGAWGFNPDNGEAHVINCHVSGTVDVSGRGRVGGSALIGAQDSTADVTITVQGNAFMSPFLWACRDCDATGSLTVDDLGGGNGEICGIMNSSGCTSDAGITVNCEDPDASNVYTYGIYARDDQRSRRCAYYGDINSPAHACAISNSDDCKSGGIICSDNILGMFNCTGSRLTGEMCNFGMRSEVRAVFIQEIIDSDPEKRYSNESEANYTYNRASNTQSLSLINVVGQGDVLSGNVNINAGSADVVINTMFSKPDDYEKFVYEWGDMTVRTTSGKIDIYRSTATAGVLRCISETGDIVVMAGAYNSGDVFASSGGDMNVVGASVYNSGNIAGNGSGGGAVIGAYGDNALNEGSVTYNGNSENTIAAIGAGGVGSTNAGSVYASNGNSGIASAVGVSGEKCLNTGAVEAYNGYTHWNIEDNGEKRGQADACGATGSQSFNTGTVSASGSCYLVHAFGNKNGASSTGEVRADGRCIANADGDGGMAIANGGQYASASGVDPYAYGGSGSSLSGATLYYWTLNYHDTQNCNCVPVATIINSDGREPSNAYHNYDLVAMTRLTSFSGGEEPETAEGEMPEADEPDKTGHVEIALFGERNMNYPISNFTYAWGSFGFDNQNADDYTHMYAMVTVANDSDEPQNYELTLRLPEGFSAQPWTVQNTVDISCATEGWESVNLWVDIYPLYRADYPGHVNFSVAGDLKNTQSVPVSRRNNEGVALCRPTEKVNSSSTAIYVDLGVDCVRDMVQCSPSRYNDNLSLMCCALSQSIYEEDYIRLTMRNLGFTGYTFCQSSGNHDVASAYAVKKVVSDGVVYPVILATVRGTVGMEWIGNFNVGDNDSYHKDFRGCADSTLQRFKDYCNQWQIPAENARAIFSAHSRAAAATNLLAHDLNITNRKYVKDLVAYCFATPNSTQSPSADSNIFNIVYVDDLVAYAPQGYYKNGVTFVLGDEDNDAPASVDYYYRKYCSRDYMNPRNTPYITGIIAIGKIVNAPVTNFQEWLGDMLSKQVGDSGIAQAHGAENYLAWVEGYGISGAQSYESVLLRYEERIRLTNERLRLALMIADPQMYVMSEVFSPFIICSKDLHDVMLAGVFCPVDVTIRNGDGSIVARIEDHEIVNAGASSALVAVENDHHFFGLNGEMDYTFEITGSGTGTMCIDMVMLDKNLECRDYVRFTDIPVAQGETYTLTMDSQQSSQEWTLVSGSGVVYHPGVAPAELPRVYLPTALTEISDEAFLNASAMTGMLVCPDGMTAIGASAFSGSGFQAIWVPESVVTISDSAFEGTDMVIYCYESSAIHRYAQENGLAFQLIE